jgi:3-isopropylmalate dehydrogenase
MIKKLSNRIQVPEDRCTNGARLLHFISPDDPPKWSKNGATVPVIGIFEGSGVGPEIISATLRVFEAVKEKTGLRCELRRGGLIGEEAFARFGQPLPESAVEFCTSIFEEGGAILSGPGGGRYVYDLRRHFDLFCKFVPVRSYAELNGAGCLAERQIHDVDLLIIRDNTGGVYQGQWSERQTDEGRVVQHTFQYSEAHVRRLVEVAARAAANRHRLLHVVIKDGGVPMMSELWRDVSGTVARAHGVKMVAMNVDLAAYELIRHPAQFDVIVAPNMIGDIVADIAGVLVASRGVTFSGNFSADKKAVYQTNHGCAADLAGSGLANPSGQILSLAMLLRESFGLDEAADLIESSLATAWANGWRTMDVAGPGCSVVGTEAMTEQVIMEVLRASPAKQSHERRVLVG